MNRLKLIVLSSALSLITIGVFAGRAKFAPADVYVNVTGIGEIKITGSALVDDLQTTQPMGATQAKIVSSLGSGASFSLYTKDGANVIPLYTQSF